MVYEKTIWKDRVVEKPNTYRSVENPDGTITLYPVTGQVIEKGTPVSAANLNKIENGLVKLSVKANDWNDFKNGGGAVNGDVKARNFHAHYFHHKMIGLDIGDWEAAGLGVINSDVSKVIQASVGRYNGVYTLYPDAKHDNVFQPMDLGHQVAPWRDLWLGKYNKNLNGYCSLPNGMLIQWGYTGTGTALTVTFPIAFSSQLSYVFTATPYFSADATGLSWRTYGANNNQISLFGTRSNNYYWIAIGW